jgi:hypothetical protein
MLIKSLGELAAFDITNPSGRYMLNLSRSLDRLIAMRMQEASALENSWRTVRGGRREKGGKRGVRKEEVGRRKLGKARALLPTTFLPIPPLLPAPPALAWLSEEQVLHQLAQRLHQRLPD